MSGIGRGTTATNTFKTSCDLREATVLYITYSQDNHVVFEKTINDVVEITEDHVVVQLTQKDTLMLDSDTKVEIQIRAGFGGENGARVVSNILKTSVGRILKEGAI